MRSSKTATEWLDRTPPEALEFRPAALDANVVKKSLSPNAGEMKRKADSPLPEPTPARS